eukprot:gene18959-24769_t
MVKAVWNGVVIAESDDVVTVEGNAYIPLSSIKNELFKKTSHTSVCGWKGTCNYYSVTVDGKTNENCCWIYENPKPEAANIKGRVAFWKGVQIQK